MPRFRGMIRGFAEVAASAGIGHAAQALAVRFPDSGEPGPGVVDDLMQIRGIASAHLLRPAPPPPMTDEQALRGADRVLPHVLIACAHDSQAIDAARDRFAAAVTGVYRLHHTATEQDLPG